jgi:hypothetical protein
MSTPVLAKLIVKLSKQQHAASKAEQQDGQQQQQLQVLLEQCGQEWLRGPSRQGDKVDAAAVAAALGAAGLQELAAAVRQVRNLNVQEACYQPCMR